MPQLDYTLLFNQLFWLFLIFVILYIMLTYYFLPVFIKILRGRKQFLHYNYRKSEEIQKNLRELKKINKKSILYTEEIQKIVTPIIKGLKNYERNLLETKMMSFSIIHFFSNKIFYYKIFDKK